MSRSVLVDVNIPQEVCERLRELGFDAVYLTEVLSEKVDDEEIAKWMETHHSTILTKDKNFPEDGGDRKIILASESSEKLTRRALLKLLDQRIFPEPLEGSWNNKG